VQNQTIFFGELFDVVDTAGILCGQSTLLEEGHDVQPIFFSKVLYVLKELVLGDAS
jgi:hypothetical protein